jgi:glycosyltransferase involved in cell wall biosynthesis
MSLTVLSVPFPFADLTADPAGGAEQVLLQIDRALCAAGHRSIVIGRRGSQVCGHLVPIEGYRPRLDWPERLRMQNLVRSAVARTCATERVELVHLHGTDFHAYLPAPGIPTLVTLHLPLDWYPQGALEAKRPLLWFNTVSASQASRAWPGLSLLSPIENGVAVDEFAPCPGAGRFALALGRVCPEKGLHHAIDASVAAAVPLLLAGVVYPWPEHQHYFETEIVPRLDSRRRWIGRIHGERKRRLMSAARCVLVPSEVPETSSLVAMESLAAGTPVIAFRIGELPRIIEDGVTGFLVDDVSAMAEAILRADRLDREACRRAARERFDVSRSVGQYLELYRRIAARELAPAAFDAAVCSSLS